MVRQELGPDALILDRQQSKSADGGALWHVHAAIDHTPSPNMTKQEVAGKQAQPDTNEPPQADEQTATQAPLQNHDATLERLERIVEGLGNRESNTLRQALKAREEQEAFDQLTEIGVAGSHAFDMANDFANKKPLGSKTIRWSERISLKQRHTLLFSGPSGSGKTTLIAKLATHYSLKGIRVVLVSTDTERMGGLDSLKSYAATLGIPFHALRKTADAGKILRQSQSAQLMLIDTEGWSPRRDANLKRQFALWDAMHCDRRILMLPANMDEEDGMQQLKHRIVSSMTDVAFSKLDETRRPGKVVNWAIASSLPMSYCSFGAEVPEQMGWLTPQALFTLLSKEVRSVPA